jgi:hypothetical protein
MRTVTLRLLLREPTKVKQFTRSGAPVQVTDRGKPLWILQPANGAEDEEERRRAMNEIFDEVMRESKSTVSMSKIIKDSRR